MSRAITPTDEAQTCSSTDQGRADLIAWERSQPENYFESDLHLKSALEFYWGADRLARHTSRLSGFGADAATVVDRAVREANRTEHLPRLDRFTALGERRESVVHCAAHTEAGRLIYRAGVMSVYAEPGNNLLALALFYLSSYNGEAGHNCPLACTAGVIKTLQYAGSDQLRAKYLPGLLEPIYEKRLHGAQFLTEVQGGSDVGANACTATRADQTSDRWLIHGEKWFCSNITADLALMTARPEGSPAGTRGLGLFLVPLRREDGTTNGISIRQLKDKLGTRSLATAEVEFHHAQGYQIGEPGTGFQQAMEYVINTSRLYNALGSAGAARRAYVLAWTYARRRRAFGGPISRYPLTQETLTEMRATTMAMTSGSLYLAHLRDQIETGEPEDADRRFFRLVVNLNKYRTSISGTDVIRRGIEVLGGNGAMENFSVMPRLLRDAVIFEAWEGAHNTLLAQSMRDIAKLRLDQPFCDRLGTWFDSLSDVDLRAAGLAELERLRNDLAGLLLRDEASASVLFKPLADRMIWLFYLACLAREIESEAARGVDLGKREVTAWLWEKHLGTVDRDPDRYLAQIAKISAVL
jgi:acyl-CoA dehydrogenase